MCSNKPGCFSEAVPMTVLGFIFSVKSFTTKWEEKLKSYCLIICQCVKKPRKEDNCVEIWLFLWCSHMEANVEVASANESWHSENFPKEFWRLYSYTHVRIKSMNPPLPFSAGGSWGAWDTFFFSFSHWCQTSAPRQFCPFSCSAGSIVSIIRSVQITEWKPDV